MVREFYGGAHCRLKFEWRKWITMHRSDRRVEREVYRTYGDGGRFVEPRVKNRVVLRDREVSIQVIAGASAPSRGRDVTDLTWWFVFFGFLRHDITHGEQIPARQYEWNDQAHLFLGESHLRQAIKQTVANAGHPDVLLDSFERITRRYADLIVQDAGASDGHAPA